MCPPPREFYECLSMINLANNRHFHPMSLLIIIIGFEWILFSRGVPSHLLWEAPLFKPTLMFVYSSKTNSLLCFSQGTWLKEIGAEQVKWCCTDFSDWEYPGHQSEAQPGVGPWWDTLTGQSHCFPMSLYRGTIETIFYSFIYSINGQSPQPLFLAVPQHMES